MKKTLTAGTDITWFLSLGRDPDAVVPEGTPEELVEAQGKYALYVMVIPQYGVAITCQRSVWDPVILAQGLQIPSQEAAHFIVKQCLDSFSSTGPTNPISAVELTGTALCWGNTILSEDAEVNTHPESVSETLIKLVDELITQSKADGIEPTKLG